MRIKVASSAGFCGGVRAAYDKALELAAEYGKVYTIGELIHNEQVVDFLHSKGVFVIDPEKTDVLKAGDVALIRAHGIPLGLESRLRERGVELFDATCPVVKKIHAIVAERRDAGDEIIIVGDPNHDEVTGSVSYGGGRARVVNDESGIGSPAGDFSIVFQTTILADKFQKIKEFAQNYEKNSNKTVGVFNTICYTTKSRQDEARSLAGECDAVFVLGSRKSANTLRLFEVAGRVNPNTFFAESAEEALSVDIKDFQSISIVAGASTPPWLIQEVTERMSENTQNTADVKTAAEETEVQKEATLQEETKTAAPAQAEPEERELTMEDVIASNRSVGYTNYKVGKRIKGTVISANEDGIFVAIGGKKDGFIDKADTSVDGNYNPADYNSGDEIEAIIVTGNNKDYVALSKKEVDVLRAEEAEAEKALAAGEFSLMMTEVVKGGLRGRLGQYTVFVPASQIKIGYVKNLEDYKGKVLRLCLLPPKEAPAAENAEATEGAEVAEAKPARKSRYLFASQRMVLEKERKEKEELFWSSMHVNDIVVGKVKRFTTFGAFVSVHGYDCLAHISELSWNKISDPSTVLKIGESYDFVVLKLDRETGKISLGYKQLQPKPYDLAAEKYPVGSVIKGKVERIFDYGAFISITDGVDGLVHVSQISHKWVKDAHEVLVEGQEVEAKIIGFEDTRITLSIKELLPPPDAAEEGDRDASAEGEDKPRRSNSRIKKFEQKVAEGDDRRERRPRREAPSGEPSEWVSGSGSATLGDLFKNLNLQLDEEPATETPVVAEEAPAAAEEAPVEAAPKKTTRKKKTEEAPATDAEAE